MIELADRSFEFDQLAAGTDRHKVWFRSLDLFGPPERDVVRLAGAHRRAHKGDGGLLLEDNNVAADRLRAESMGDQKVLVRLLVALAAQLFDRPREECKGVREAVLQSLDRGLPYVCGRSGYTDRMNCLELVAGLFAVLDRL